MDKGEWIEYAEGLEGQLENIRLSSILEKEPKKEEILSELGSIQMEIAEALGLQEEEEEESNLDQD